MDGDRKQIRFPFFGLFSFSTSRIRQFGFPHRIETHSVLFRPLAIFTSSDKKGGGRSRGTVRKRGRFFCDVPFSLLLSCPDNCEQWDRNRRGREREKER